MMRAAAIAALAAPLGAAALLAGCAPPARDGWSGYVEGEYVYVAAPVAGTLAALPAVRGRSVEPGAPLFELDDADAAAARREAEARLRAAEAEASDAAKGRRPDEIAVGEAQLAQARVQKEQAGRALDREQRLVAQGFVSDARLDELRTAARQAAARVAELEASLRVARLPARSDQRAAAEAATLAARAVLADREWRAGRTRPTAPTGGRVVETYYRVGEWVGAGQPVLALLPPSGLKARFYVPEAEIATIAPGRAVELRCDGCGAPIAATVDFIATEAEYTPPVIYSNAQRARLVFLVEARPQARDAARLRPGLPVDVRPVAVPQ